MNTYLECFKIGVPVALAPLVPGRPLSFRSFHLNQYLVNLKFELRTAQNILHNLFAEFKESKYF